MNIKINFTKNYVLKTVQSGKKILYNFNTYYYLLYHDHNIL